MDELILQIARKLYGFCLIPRSILIYYTSNVYIDNFLEICSACFRRCEQSHINMYAYPTSIALQVTTYVVTRPGRELLFTVVSQDEKYKAKVISCIIRHQSLLLFYNISNKIVKCFLRNN